MTCSRCSSPIVRTSNRGRPPKYCSSCAAEVRVKKKREGRARVREADQRLDEVSATMAERKVHAVWQDDALRSTWATLINTHDKYLRWIVVDFNGGDLPQDLQPEQALRQIAWLAVAELVYDNDTDRITKAMIKARVRSRMISALRKSDEFEYVQTVTVPTHEGPVTVISADGSKTVVQPEHAITVRRQTRRKQAPTRKYECRDVAGERAAATVDRARAFEQLAKESPAEHFVAWLWIVFTKPAKTVRNLMAALSRREGVAVPLGLDWTAYSAAAEGGALGALHRFFAGQGWTFERYPDPMLVELLRGALEKIGDEIPEELHDDAAERAEDDDDLWEQFA